MARPMVMESAPDPRVRASILVPGTMASRCLVCTPGPVAVSLRVIGKMGSVMDWEWRVGGSGSTEENGLKDSRVAMESDNQHRHQQSMKEPGPMVFRMAMVQRRMLMEERIRVNGCEV